MMANKDPSIQRDHTQGTHHQHNASHSATSQNYIKNLNSSDKSSIVSAGGVAKQYVGELISRVDFEDGSIQYN
jgi:hypothetical protein